MWMQLARRCLVRASLGLLRAAPWRSRFPHSNYNSSQCSSRSHSSKVVYDCLPRHPQKLCRVTAARNRLGSSLLPNLSFLIAHAVTSCGARPQAHIAYALSIAHPVHPSCRSSNHCLAWRRPAVAQRTPAQFYSWHYVAPQVSTICQLVDISFAESISGRLRGHPCAPLFRPSHSVRRAQSPQQPSRRTRWCVLTQRV